MGTNRLAPLSGALAVVLVIAGFAATGSAPGDTASVATIADYYGSHSGAQTTSGVLLSFAALAFLVFAATLVARLREADCSSGLGRTVPARRRIFATGLATYAGVAIAMGDVADSADAAALQALNVLADGPVFVFLFTIGAGAFLLGAGSATLAAGLLPRWLGMAGLCDGSGGSDPEPRPRRRTRPHRPHPVRRARDLDDRDRHRAGRAEYREAAPSLTCPSLLTADSVVRTPRSRGVEARHLEIEIALHLPHHHVADLARVPELDHRVPLHVQQLPPQTLILERPLLDLRVAVGIDARVEAADPEPVEGAGALGRVGKDPGLALELVEPCDRGLGGADARERLLRLLLAVVGLEPERADHRRQRQTLDDERREHDREGEEDDQVPAGERVARVGLERDQRGRRRS